MTRLDLVEGLEQLDNELGKLIPTETQKKEMTKAGAEVYKQILTTNMNNSLHKGKYSRDTKIDLSKSISMRYKSEDGATFVGFKNDKENPGYIARFLNDGYMAHGGKGKSAHSTKYIPGLHFQEHSIEESKNDVLEAEAKVYRQLNGD